MTRMNSKTTIEYLGRVLLIVVGRIVEWALCMSLAVLLLAAAYWLYMGAGR